MSQNKYSTWLCLVFVLKQLTPLFFRQISKDGALINVLYFVSDLVA